MRRLVPPRNRWFLPALAVRLSLYGVARLVYAVSTKGLENVPSRGPVLLLPNHISYVDVVLLQLAYPRYIHFVAHEFLFRIRWLGWFLRLMGVIPIRPKDPRRALREVLETLEEGRVVCLFPEGRISRTGCLQRLKPGFRTLAARAGCPVQPAFIDGIWGSIFSFSGNRFGGRPLRYRHPIRVRIGSLLPPGGEMSDRVRESLLDLGAAAFDDRPELEGNLGRRAILALAKRPWRHQLVDLHPPRRELSRGLLLGLAIAYSRRIRSTVGEERVGVALPPGAGAILANLAATLAGKAVVNLDVAAEPAKIRSACERTDVKTVIAQTGFSLFGDDSAGALRVVDLRRELGGLGGLRLLWWSALVHLLPGAWLAGLLGVPRRGGDREAAVLFAGGEAGRADGVTLTHRGLLADLERLSSVNLFAPGERFLVSSPKFGYANPLFEPWYPLLCEGEIISAPASADLGSTAAAAERERATVLLGEPEFVEAFVGAVPKEKTGELRFALRFAGLGGERSTRSSAAGALPVLDGFGGIDGLPLVSMNLPNPATAAEDRQEEGNRPGTLGRLLPGIGLRLTAAETGSAAAGEGRPLFRRPPGTPKTERVSTDGTVVGLDEDGFLFSRSP